MHSPEVSASGAGLETGTNSNQGAVAGPDADSGGVATSGATRRWWDTRAVKVVAWTVAAVAVLACYVKISYGARINSDGANIALQGWDWIHGNLVMHGWFPGDATYYGYEVPILGICEVVLGLGVRAVHVASGLAYLFVTVAAVALAAVGARGTAKVARAGVVVAVLAAPLLTVLTVWTMLEEPDHPGSAIFVLVPALLIEFAVAARSAAGRVAKDRIAEGQVAEGRVAAGRRWVRWGIPVLVCLVLCVGQISDATTKFVIIPALVLVCAYRLLVRARTGRGQDGGTPWYRSFEAALGLAALVSVPLGYAVHAGMSALGGYQPVTPNSKIAPPGLWPHHVLTTWLVIRELFSAVPTSWTSLGGIGVAFGWLALLAAIAGLARVIWTWRRASWAEQFLAVTIVVFVAVYAVSAMTHPTGYREISEIVPCGAVLAARALVPSRVTGLAKRWGALAIAAAAAAFPLAVSASRPDVGPALGPAPFNSASAPTWPLTSFLKSHHLTYGLSDYWSSSTVTLQSDDTVRLRSITMVPETSSAVGWVPHVPYWETDGRWYEASRNDATFVVTRSVSNGRYDPAKYEAIFGKPVAVYHVSVWTILDYQRNLLTQLPPMLGVGVGPKS